MHLQDLMNSGIIKESRSLYASPIVIVRQKTGTIRMCIDYHTLNGRTIADQYTVPHVQDALDCLVGSQWFSVLDLHSGYYQILLWHKEKEKNCFYFLFRVLPIQKDVTGNFRSPIHLSAVSESVVGDMNMTKVLVYLNNLIVFGRTLEEHEGRLMKVLDRLEAVALK